ncbi:MAG: hypothetical protein HOC78_00460 [Candidatus Komeilibacteria bacterium]|jgi:hypothetical protein|nr:hypothetical protein [Candidatus Komeilibacteria bacterium]
MNQTIKRKSSNTYSKLVGFFLFLTVIAIFVVTHFALAKVHIKIYTDLEEKEASVLIEIQSENNENLSADALIGKIINTDIEITATVASNKETINSDKAGGYVTIYNNYSKDQPLIKTTRLLTPDDKLFRLSEGVTVPAGSQVKVWAEADGEGEGFVTEVTTFIIPGLWEGLQDKIYAKSFDGMSLQSIPGFTVSQENLDAAREQIRKEAITQSLAIINGLVADKLAINQNRLKLYFEDISSNQVGDISEETSVTQKITAHGLIFDQENFINKAKEKLSKELEGGQVLVNFDEEKITYNVLEINLEKDEAILEVKTSVTVSSSENIWDIDKGKLIGLNEQDLRVYFKQFNPEKIDIEFSPFWVKTTPLLKDHIIIE